MDAMIRKYDITDYFAVNNILESVFGYGKVNCVPDDNCSEYVAIYNDKICGYFVMTKILDVVRGKYYFNVGYVCVDPKYQNKGIGKKMMMYAEEEALKENAMYLELTSGRQRVVAHHLYESCGFVMRDSDIYRKVLE